MIILYIILAILAVLTLLLLFVLLSRLGIRIKYSDGVVAYASLSFIKIKLYPKDEKRKKKEEKSKKKAEKVKKEKNSGEKKQDRQENRKENDIPDENEKSSLKESLSLVFDIIKSFCDMVGKRGKIRIDVLRVVISRPDAADTAVMFGVCGGIVSSILAFTSNFGKAVIKDENVCITPDFVSGKSSIEIDITLSARVIFILSSLVSGYMKNRFRK